MEVGRHHDKPVCDLGYGREIELEECSAPATRARFERGKSYIRSDALVARLIEKRDENLTAVDYDLDSEDEEVLHQVNRQVRDKDGTGGQDSLSVGQLEAWIHALEVASFEVMMQYVEVPKCTAYMDSTQPGLFSPLAYHNPSLVSQRSSPVSGPPSPVDIERGPLTPLTKRNKDAIRERQMTGKERDDCTAVQLPNKFFQKRFSFFLGSEPVFKWAPTWPSAGDVGKDVVIETPVREAVDPASAVSAPARLNAVVKRSPPRKMNEAEELGVCAVCLNDGAEEGNLIILCDGCGIAVHQVSLHLHPLTA